MDLSSYNLVVEKSLRNAVREIISKAQFSGLEKDKNYYIISMATNYDGVVIPDELRQKYPKEITIILQNQFLIKEVSEKEFIVNLSFNGKYSDLTIPFGAISMFYDPYAEFILKFSESTEEKENSNKTTENDAKKIRKAEIEQKLVSFEDFKDLNKK